MGYEQLKAILEQAKKEAEDKAKQPVTSCPECAYVPLKVNSRNEKLCPICLWSG